MRKLFAALLLSVCSLAQAVTIGFEGLGEGTAPGTSYSSLGATFSGGRIAYNEDGAYVSGPFSVQFAEPVTNVRFYIDGLTIDSMSTVCFAGNTCEPFQTGSMSYNPMTGTGKNADWHPGQVWLDDLMTNGIVSIGFQTAAFDNLSWEVPVTGEVPEPSNILIFALGLVFLYGRHRQNNDQAIQYRT